jgi:DNA-binding GntR family transcriptional regulator
VSTDAGAQELGPASRRVLADEVADALRTAIVTGSLGSGQRLIEHELATQLAVSRGPVREALTRLSQEGLVVVDRHRGATVAALSGSEAAEIYSLRTVLEQLAGEWACQTATDEDLAAIGRVVAQFDELPRPLTRQAVAALDVGFHDAIFRASHHDRAYRAWRALCSQLSLYLVQRGALDGDFTAAWRDSHQKLLEALQTRDRTVVAQAIAAHIKGV